jgi:hypothetical protein
MAFIPSSQRGAANLTTILTCGSHDVSGLDSASSNVLCSFVPGPRVRGTLDLYFAFFCPIIIAAFGTVYMRASRSWLRRALHLIRQLFVPEWSLYKVVEEETTRSSVMKILEREGHFGTKSQLMAIQKGKLYISLSPTAEHVRRRSTMTLGNAGSLTTWCTEKPHRDAAAMVEIEEVDTYKHLLQLLPTGSTTWKGMGSPDVGTAILALQLAWVIGEICTRLGAHLRVSVLELFALYSLTSFVTERLATLLRRPAWSQHVVVKDVGNPYGISVQRERRAIPNTWKHLLLVFPLLQAVMWPVFMFLYAEYAEQEAWTRAVFRAAAASHLGGSLFFVTGAYLSGLKNLRWVRYLMWTVSGVAFVFSRVFILGLALLQVHIGEKEIFIVPEQKWGMPHIGG